MSTFDPLAIALRGTVLVEASAGTGKTFTLCNLYLRLLVEAERAVSRVLVLTYTKAATAELRGRIRERLRAALLALRDGPPADADDFLTAFVAARRTRGQTARDARLLEVALRSFDEAAIFTIHGFCQRMLLENAFESASTFDAELVADQRPLCRELVEDYWVRHLHDAPLALVAHLAGTGAKGGIDELEELVAKVVAHPDVPVLPERPLDLPRDEIEAAAAQRRSAFQRAAALWNEARQEIVEGIAGSTTLKGNLYPPARVRGDWAPRLDALFRDATGHAKLDERVGKLRSSALASGVKKGQRPPTHRFFDACQALCEADAVLQECLCEAALRFRLGLVAWARGEARRRHERANAQSFDDLLHRLRDALRGASGAALAARLRDRFPAALVDEFQDTDPVQYEILRTVYRDAPGPLLLIGDPKQAIYAFRGADIFAYLRARRDAGDAPHTLETNHRSDPGLVEAMNALFGRARLPFLVEGIPYVPMSAAREEPRLHRPGGTPPSLEILFLPRDGASSQDRALNKDAARDAVSKLVAAEIARLLASGATIGGEPLAPGHVAVLCRTNAQAERVQEELRALDIPSVRHGDDSVFDAEESRDLEDVLRGVAEPGDAARLRGALVTRTIGLDANALHALGSDEDGWDRWAARFRAWHDLWISHGFMAAFRRLLEECGVAPRLLGEEGGERALTNLLHLAELLQTEAMASHRGPLALVDWLAAMRTDPERRRAGSDAAEVRLESDARAVQLTTVHRAKGLEYGVVFCPFLWDGNLLFPSDARWVRFHADDADRTLCLDVAGAEDPEHEARTALSRQDALAESLRLLYVALTRARHACAILWGGFSGAESSALAYLLHQASAPRELEGEALAEWIRERVKKLDDASIRAELGALAASSGGSVGVRDLDVGAPPLFHPGREAPRPLVHRRLQRPLAETRRIASFSALVAAQERLGRRAEEGIDHDAQVGAESTSEGSAGEATAGEVRVRLHDFPAGARTGQLVHDILEHLDFAADDAAITAVVARRARRHRLPEAIPAALVEALREVLTTPLPTSGGSGSSGGGFRLVSIPRSRTLREMPFTLPAALSGDAPLDANVLADAFASLGSPPARAYAERLRRIGFAELRGYLTGVVDLVVEHDDRFWLIDYKTNLLGPRPADYAPAVLEEEMRRHHYVFQSHLYTVALHAHLARRLPGYDYDRHVGGALYLFLRGMSPAHPPGTGVCFDRPSRALIERLAGLFAAAPRRAGAAA